MTKKTKHLSKKFLSCVTPVMDEELVIKDFITQLYDTLSENFEAFEIIIVDDGSSDNTLRIVEQCYQLLGCIKIIELSRNFGKEAALTAGIEYADGDIVLLIDSDFQHPFNMIPVFLEHINQGYEMVYGIRKNRNDESLLKKKGANFFYKIMRTSTGVKIPNNAGDFRMMTRKAILALRSLPERNRFMKGIYAWIGFKSIGIPYNVHRRKSGKSSWNYRKLANLAISGITSFTTLPLRLVGVVGLLISATSMGYGLYILFRTMVLGNAVPGWPTMIIAITFLGGIQLLSLGILGEYISGIFNEVKQRPNYLVRKYTDFNKN